tara:strand:- start:1516 stop:1947 length:432 start_codon:yes stop_codon:yes gene_type:complete
MEIINKILLNGQFSILKNYITANNFPWFYKTDYFSHIFYQAHAPKSDGFNCIIPLLDELKVNALMDASVLLLPSTYGTFGIELESNSKAALIFLYSCNGYVLHKEEKEACEENKGMLFNEKNKYTIFSQTDVKKNIMLVLNYY